MAWDRVSAIQERNSLIVRPICRFLDSVFSLGRTCKEANRPKYGFSARTKLKMINQPSDEMANDSR